MVDRQQVARLAGLAAVTAGTMAMVWTPPAGVPDYSLAAVRVGTAAVPRSFVLRLPEDIRNGAGASLEMRKRLFLKTVLPVILRANESIMKERGRLARLAAARKRGSAIGGRDRAWLVRLAERYGVEDADLMVLKRRVDIVPASLALAQAAIESGWGTSRFAAHGNALFGMRSWSPGAGLAPKDASEGARFTVSAFDTISQSVRHYVHTLNSHHAYRRWRVRRQRLRAVGAPLDGRKLVAGLEPYSEEGAAYMRLVRRIIATERLWQFDRAALASP